MLSVEGPLGQLYVLVIKELPGQLVAVHLPVELFALLSAVGPPG